MPILIIMQLWARAFRDQTYHAAINTTNGVESQNKLLKYNYLPRKKNLTLSQLVILLYDEFIPESHHKHLYLNYRMSSAYREYNDFVPIYLRGRPRRIIRIEEVQARSTLKRIFSLGMSLMVTLHSKAHNEYTPLILAWSLELHMP
jgi:hypothetical protein